MIPEDREGGGAHAWMVFADLMAGLLGLFVVFFVWAILFQVQAAEDLEVEKAESAAKSVRLEALETALAEPLAGGRITFAEGRIGISGSVLFDLYSADLRPDGRSLLRQLARPLGTWLRHRDELVMVGGFTDDLAITDDEPRFADNWELSTERALTVVRVLAEAGVPPDRLFAAGFGAHHPNVPNRDETSRARNRRVEIVPVPKTTTTGRGG